MPIPPWPILQRFASRYRGRARAASLGTVLCAACVALSGAPAAAQSANAADAGRREYQSACATCHGIDGRGDGPMKPFLLRAPADLTTLSARRGGAFPRQQIADLIDGRGVEGPGPHGTREMPVWGLVYREEADWRLRGVPFPAEWSVRGRILALVDYLATLQRF